MAHTIVGSTAALRNRVHSTTVWDKMSRVDGTFVWAKIIQCFCPRFSTPSTWRLSAAMRHSLDCHSIVNGYVTDACSIIYIIANAVMQIHKRKRVVASAEADITQLKKHIYICKSCSGDFSRERGLKIHDERRPGS